jgi:hypothetical protein
MAQSATTPKNGTTSAPGKTYPRAFGDYYHMRLVVDYLDKCLTAVHQQDVDANRDTLDRVDRKAAEAFVRACRVAVPDPDAQPTTTEG